MTKEQEVYVTLLNTLGSDVEPPEIQAMVDRVHAKADPEFAAMVALRACLDQAKALKLITTIDQECGVFASDGERELYIMTANTWNTLQALIKTAEVVAR